jgi:hypothetical protein
MGLGSNDLEEIIRRMRKEEAGRHNSYNSKTYKPKSVANDVAEMVGKAADSFMKGGAEFLNAIFFKKNINTAGGGGSGNGTTQPPNNQNNPRGNNMNFKTIAAVVVLTLTIGISPMLIGINDAGYRTVIQYPNGTLAYQFEPGLYMQWFGNVEVYNDVITFDFDKTTNEESATLDQLGIAVRYQDGGTGTVYGIARFRLPILTDEMAKIHKEFRSNDGVAHKIIKNTTEEIMNHTAGLVTSEESYTDRGTYTQRAKTQLRMGKFDTEQEEITTVEAGMEFCLADDLTPKLKEECHDVKKTKKIIPIISTVGGVEQHTDNDLKQYGITLSGFNMVDWGYEPKTLKQISDKREATMAIITSKANAERAKQDTITAEQQGLANVKTAQYQEEVIKQKAVVVAEREKEVAEIAAQQKVEVARQAQLEAVQKKLAAKEIKQEQILLGEGEAERKSLVMEADGALEIKVNAWKEVNFAYAREFGKQKWVPEVQMGSNGGASGSAAQDLIELMTVNNAKQLSLDMSMKGKR